MTALSGRVNLSVSVSNIGFLLLEVVIRNVLDDTVNILILLEISFVVPGSFAVIAIRIRNNIVRVPGLDDDFNLSR